jgi:hypothetical protein
MHAVSTHYKPCVYYRPRLTSLPVRNSLISFRNSVQNCCARTVFWTISEHSLTDKDDVDIISARCGILDPVIFAWDVRRCDACVSKVFDCMSQLVEVGKMTVVLIKIMMMTSSNSSPDSTKTGRETESVRQS